MGETINETKPVETVPKEELSKVQSQLAEKDRTLETLKSQLLDPEYIAYLDSKNNKVSKTIVPNNANLTNLSLDQLRQLIAETSAEVVKKEIAPLSTRITQAEANLEYRMVTEKYPDFNNYADAIVPILEANPHVNMEQAYLMVKGSKGNETSKETSKDATPKETPKGAERPGATVPLDGDTVKKFKNETDAGMAAWAEVSKKYGLSGDTI